MAGFYPHRSPWRLFAIAVLLTSALCFDAAPARAQGATGDIRGSVSEQGAGPLAGVTVVALNQASGVRRTVKSGIDGLFTIGNLPAGVYEIVATLPGFAEQRQQRVEIGSGEMFVSRMEMRRRR